MNKDINRKCEIVKKKENVRAQRQRSGHKDGCRWVCTSCRATF